LKAQISLWVCGVLVVGGLILAGGETTKPASEVDALRATLLAQTGTGRHGLRVPEGNVGKQAVDRLEQMGTAEAVEALRAFMVLPNGQYKLKMLALTALGRIGSKEAVAAIDHFEQWANSRPLDPKVFRFGSHNYGIDHFSPTNLQPLATSKDGEGRTWAVFRWSRYGRGHCWLTQSTGLQEWSAPMLVGAGPDYRQDTSPVLHVDGERFTLTAGGQTFRYSLSEAGADADKDGLLDLEEGALGTDPTKADSDGDGVDDGVDRNPLTPKHTAKDDETQIRQAVFSVLYATNNSLHAIVVVNRPRQEDMREAHEAIRKGRQPVPKPVARFAQQEYYGYSGRVLRSPQSRRGFVNFTGLSLKMTSNTTATAEIVDWEGELAASGHHAELKKIHGKWVVVEFKMTWIS